MVVVQTWWLLCCVAAVWLSVAVCSVYDRRLMSLLYATYDWPYSNKVSINIDEYRNAIPSSHTHPGQKIVQQWPTLKEGNQSKNMQ